jgi:hypothetical protein
MYYRYLNILKTMKKSFLLSVLFFVFTAVLSARVTLPALVGDNMALQQKSDIKIWGWDKPGTSIEVITSWGEKGTTKANKEGNWVVTINTPAASFTPQTITVSDGDPVTINNILIGEVWLCSGQSNMEMTFKGAWGGLLLGQTKQ